MSKQNEPEIVETRDLALNEWLKLLFSPPKGKVFEDYCFPTDKHKEEYLSSIHERTEEEVILLLKKFLFTSTSLGIDDMRIDNLLLAKKANPEMFANMMRLQYYQRLLKYSISMKAAPPWEGNTWVLDLLPHFPKDAIDGLNAYIFAHVQVLPDGRLNGLFDAVAIIRAKFIGLPGTTNEKIDFLGQISWRDFEILVAKLYERMGYFTELTPAQKDNGRDILAHRQEPTKQEHLRIECKHYFAEPVGLGIVQRLLGVVAGEKVNKGVLVTTSRFTEPAKTYAKENPRIELIDGNELVLLLNEYLGYKWPQHLDRYIGEFQKQSQKNEKFNKKTNKT